MKLNRKKSYDIPKIDWFLTNWNPWERKIEVQCLLHREVSMILLRIRRVWRQKYAECSNEITWINQFNWMEKNQIGNKEKIIMRTTSKNELKWRTLIIWMSYNECAFVIWMCISDMKVIMNLNLLITISVISWHIFFFIRYWNYIRIYCTKKGYEFCNLNKEKSFILKIQNMCHT